MPTHRPPHVAVIGGGAAGLMASLAAAQNGAKVTLIERESRVGRKLLATGNGRCNLTNLHAAPRYYHYNGDAAASMALVAETLAQVPPTAVLDVFESLGLLWRADEMGRVYPHADQAASVLDVLRMGCARAGISVRCDQRVRSIVRSGAGLSLALADGETLLADRIVLAAGGRASPQLGSDGSGHALLAALGHRMTPCHPALVQLRCDHPALRGLKGLRASAEAALLIDGRPALLERGEVLFTDYGLSGIAVLNLARAVSPALHTGRSVSVRLNLLPKHDASVRSALVRAHAALFAAEPAGQLATGLLPRRIGEALCKSAQIPLDVSCAALSPAQLDVLAELLGDWRFPVVGTLDFAHAQVTAGGADARDFDPATLASRIVPGLYAAGEVLDVDGDCGGFNLQFAWASGLIAGKNATGKGTP